MPAGISEYRARVAADAYRSRPQHQLPMSLLTFLVALPALAPFQDAPPAAAPDARPAQQAPEPMLALWIDDMPGLMPSPKDAGLVAALSMLDERLLDLLVEELEPGQAPVPPNAVGLASKLLMGRKSLRVVANSAPDAELPVIVQLEMQENSTDDARALGNELIALLTDMGMEVSQPNQSGQRLLQMPDGPPIAFALNGPNMVASVGGSLPAPGRPALGVLPQGVRPTMSMHLDIGAMTEMFLASIEGQAPASDVEEMTMVFDAYGLTNLVMDLNVGVDAERTHSRLTMPGYGATLRAMGMATERGLTERDFAMVPADAQWAQLTTFDAAKGLDYLLRVMDPMLRAEGIDDPIGMLQEETGFNLRSDVLDHLGSTLALYTSRSTGGGGMLSSVATMELTNSAGMLETLNRLRGLIDGIAASEMDGYMRVHGWKSGDTNMMTLTFPGLPVPLEMTLAVTPTHLVLGMTPQATLGAVEHMGSGRPGLLANERLRAQMPADPVGAVQVQFVDVKELGGEAYGLASLLTSMVANSVRSPSSDREPGLIMPSYPRLLGDAKAMVTVARIVGEDVVEMGRADNSVLVNLSGMLGMVGSSPLLLAVGTGMVSGLATSRMAPQPYIMEPAPAQPWDDEEWEVTEPVDAPVGDEPLEDDGR